MIPESLHGSARRGHWALVSVALGLGAFWPLSAAPKDDVVEAPPVLVTTESKPKWADVKELAAAADKGDPAAAFEYARLLEAGDQVPADPARALTYYRRAAEAHHGDALFRLGKITHHGQLGVTVDYPKTMELYRRAAWAGVPEAMYNIGAMLVSGRGVKRDYIEGLAWLLVAAERGADAGGGVEQVRARLAKRPEMITSAERRAADLKEELKKPFPVPGTAPTRAGIPTPTPPAVDPVDAPRPDVEAIKPPTVPIEPPKVTLPGNPLE